MANAPLDVALVARKSDDDCDWWVIERAEHDGRMWLERTGPRSSSLMCSSRIGNADIEGTGEEMRALAEAILAGGRASFRRCCAVTTPDGVLMHSPRNSIDHTLVTRAAAEGLAAQILRDVQPPPQAPEAVGL
jgi:hypothetical protein